MLPLMARFHAFLWLNNNPLYLCVCVCVCIYIYIYIYICIYIFPGGSDGKESTCNAGDLGLISALGRSPGEGNGNILSWEISWREEPSRPQSMGSQRVRHDWATKHSTYMSIYIHTHHIFFIHSPIDGHFHWYHILSLVNNTTMNRVVLIFSN